MKKRVLSIILAVALACALLPTVALAATVTQVVPYQYDEVKDFSDGLAAVKLSGKWGFIDTTGKEVVPCKYNEVKDFSEGLAGVRLCTGYETVTKWLEGASWTEKVPVYHWGFVDATGREVAPCQYAKVEDFHDGLAVVQRNSKYGVIDTTGKEVIPCQYSIQYNLAPEFHDGLAKMMVEASRVKVGDGIYNLTHKWVYIDKTGKEVMSIGEDEKVGYFSEGLAAVKRDGKYGFIDKTGKEVIPCTLEYSEVDSFSNGLAAVKRDGKYGFIDKTGREVVPCKYTTDHDYDAPEFHDGVARVKLNGKWGLIDTTGREVVPCKYDKVEDFSDGLAAVYGDTGEMENGRTVKKWGVVDTTGKEVVPCKYDKVEDFSDGLAAVRLYSGKNTWGQESFKWGFIDKTGKEVIPCKYTTNYDYQAPEFHDGLAAVRRDYEWGFIDTTGREVVPIGKYNEVKNFSEGLAAVKTGKGWGYVDLHGNEVIPCQYGKARQLSEGMLAVAVNDKWGFVRVEGLLTEPATPAPVAPADNTAYASTQTVMVDGRPVTFNAYALKDANGNDTNYIKLRDVADILNGSAAQFQVGWDGSIAITTNAAYTRNGTEMVQNFTGNQSYTVSTSPVTVNGAPTNLEAITLTDASGGGYTYFKLRDLGAALGFNVSWDAQTGITIDPNTPYNAND